MTTDVFEQVTKNLVKVEQIDNFGNVQAIDTALTEVIILHFLSSEKEDLRKI
ncbi:hypothetical protein VXQ35_10475 [Acinetobacter oleivorans]|uniref:hypothetical protein n=1 Tax=Acinetobacter oleivorans TaxID=1148157 RepID=UPI003A8ADCEC